MTTIVAVNVQKMDELVSSLENIQKVYSERSNGEGSFTVTPGEGTVAVSFNDDVDSTVYEYVVEALKWYGVITENTVNV